MAFNNCIVVDPLRIINLSCGAEDLSRSVDRGGRGPGGYGARCHEDSVSYAHADHPWFGPCPMDADRL